MAMGAGIVASRLAQIAEVLEHGKTALLVQPGSPAELANAICLLISDASLRNELGRNARRCAETRHTWRRHTERIIAHVRLLAKTNPHPALYFRHRPSGLALRGADLSQRERSDA
jgi:glycosyltransferase involved in cell wall biosynthesis